MLIARLARAERSRSPHAPAGARHAWRRGHGGTALRVRRGGRAHEGGVRRQRGARGGAQRRSVHRLAAGRRARAAAERVRDEQACACACRLSPGDALCTSQPPTVPIVPCCTATVFGCSSGRQRAVGACERVHASGSRPGAACVAGAAQPLRPRRRRAARGGGGKAMLANRARRPRALEPSGPRPLRRAACSPAGSLTDWAWCSRSGTRTSSSRSSARRCGGRARARSTRFVRPESHPQASHHKRRSATRAPSPAPACAERAPSAVAAAAAAAVARRSPRPTSSCSKTAPPTSHAGPGATTCSAGPSLPVTPAPAPTGSAARARQDARRGDSGGPGGGAPGRRRRRALRGGAAALGTAPPSSFRTRTVHSHCCDGPLPDARCLRRAPRA